MIRRAVTKEIADPVTSSKKFHEIGNKMFVSKSDNLIDADSIQMSAGIELGRVI